MATETNPLHRDITDAEWDAMIGAAPQMLEALNGFVAAYAHLTTRQLEACADRETYGRVSPHIAVSVLSARAAIAEAAPKPAPRRITGKQALRIDDMSRKG